MALGGSRRPPCARCPVGKYNPKDGIYPASVTILQRGEQEDNRIFQKILPPVPPHIPWLSHVRKTITPNFFPTEKPFGEELFLCQSTTGPILGLGKLKVADRQALGLNPDKWFAKARQGPKAVDSQTS